MRVVGIIPARAGSKGIKGKNKKLLLGKPLIEYTLEAALASKLNAICVTTDDAEVKQISLRYKVKVIDRPSELSKDDSPTLGAIQHAYRIMAEEADAVMTLQPTSPLRNSIHINEAMGLFASVKNADSLVSVVKVPHNMVPESQMKEEKGILKSYLKEGRSILRRQDKPLYYARNGAAIYITKSDRLKDFVLGGKILGYEMSKLESFDLDDEDDWELITQIMRNK